MLYKFNWKCTSLRKRLHLSQLHVTAFKLYGRTKRNTIKKSAISGSIQGHRSRCHACCAWPPPSTFTSSGLRCTTTWLIIYVLCREFIFSTCWSKRVVASCCASHEIRVANVLAVLHILVIGNREDQTKFIFQIDANLPIFSIVGHSVYILQSVPVSSVSIAESILVGIPWLIQTVSQVDLNHKVGRSCKQ